MIALDSGAEDLTVQDDSLEIITSPEDFEAVREAVEASGAAVLEAELTMLPQSTVKSEGKEAQRMLRLMEALEDSGRCSEGLCKLRHR